MKSCRDHKASLVDSYAKIDSYGEVWLVNSHINEYKQGNSHCGIGLRSPFQKLRGGNAELLYRGPGRLDEDL